MRWRLIAAMALALATLGGAAALQQRLLRRSKLENLRLKRNQQSLLGKVRYYSTRDSLQAASVLALELTVRELKTHRLADASLIKSLGIRLRDVQAVATVASSSENVFEAPLRDTVVVEQQRTDTLRCLSYRSPWFEIDGCLDGQNVLRGTATSYDTLVAIPHIERKRFLFFRYGVKAIRLEAVNKNPHSKIYFQEYYQIKK